MANSQNISIRDIAFKNEKDLTNNTEEELKKKILNIWKEMNRSIYNGMQQTGELTGKMKRVGR